jgi:6-phosphogluconolactonase (cycloisomerase 2 family)
MENGLVTFDGKLYVVTRVSETIDVYGAEGTTFELLERMKVPGILYCTDLAVCRSMRYLFVSDRDARCIWRVNLLPDSHLYDKTDWSPFTANLKYAPHRLSIQSEQLLVTANDGDSLHVYDIKDVRTSRRVFLPDYMDVCHAVETSCGTFVVAHMSKWFDYTRSDHTGVSELTASGRVLRVYKGSTPLTYPVYITNVIGSYLVSDRVNRKIFSLNIDLELTQLLIADLEGYPLHQYYDAGMLYVSNENSDMVAIYNVWWRL